VQAWTPVIPNRGDNKHTVVLAQLQSALKHRLSRSSRGLLAAAHVNNMSSLLHGLLNGSGQVEL
jgi:hypothetical protein